MFSVILTQKHVFLRCTRNILSTGNLNVARISRKPIFLPKTLKFQRKCGPPFTPMDITISTLKNFKTDLASGDGFQIRQYLKSKGDHYIKKLYGLELSNNQNSFDKIEDFSKTNSSQIEKS